MTGRNLLPFLVLGGLALGCGDDDVATDAGTSRDADTLDGSADGAVAEDAGGRDAAAGIDGVFANNVVVLRTADLRTFFNVGGGTSPESFVFANNLWFAEDEGAGRSELRRHRHPRGRRRARAA